MTLTTYDEHHGWFDGGIDEYPMIAMSKTEVTNRDNDHSNILELRYYDGDVIEIKDIAERSDGTETLDGILTLSPRERGLLRDALKYTDEMPRGADAEYRPPDSNMELYSGPSEMSVVFERDRGHHNEMMELTASRKEMIRSFLPHCRTSLRVETRFRDHDYVPVIPNYE